MQKSEVFANVVPFAGTWIEMIRIGCKRRNNEVVPFAGTWIEILGYGSVLATLGVVPFAGTWIEIYRGCNTRHFSSSFPSRERGLKSEFARLLPQPVESFPSRERGLKSCGYVVGTWTYGRSLRGNVD